MISFLNNFETLELAKIKIEIEFMNKFKHYDEFEKIK